MWKFQKNTRPKKWSLTHTLTFFFYTQSRRRSSAKSERDRYSPSKHAGLAPGAHRLPIPRLKKKSRKIVIFILKKSTQPSKRWSFHENWKPSYSSGFWKKNPDTQLHQILNPQENFCALFNPYRNLG